MNTRKLRKRILAEAICGNLTADWRANNPVTQTGADLLAEIRKTANAKKPLAPITDDEKPFEIPDTWTWCRLGEVCEINPTVNAEDDTIAAFVPMEKVEPGFVNIFTYEKRIWKNIKNGYTKFINGDVAIAKITPCFENRKSTILENLPNGIGAGTTELNILRPIKMIAKFVLFFAKTDYFINYGVSHFTGAVGQQRFGGSRLKETPFALPPQTEQEEIVRRIEGVLGELEKVK